MVLLTRPLTRNMQSIPLQRTGMPMKYYIFHVREIHMFTYVDILPLVPGCRIMSFRSRKLCKWQRVYGNRIRWLSCQLMLTHDLVGQKKNISDLFLMSSLL